MDPIFLTLLTIAANTLITYFLLNRQERRLAQKSFEDQLKSKMVHEKKFQTLETLYQKYLAFERAFSSAIWSLQYVHSEHRRIKFITTDLALLKDFEGGYGKLEECIDYLDENRIFLPDSMATEIRTMFVNSSFPHTIIRYISELNTNQKEEFANAVNEELPNAKFNLVVCHT